MNFGSRTRAPESGFQIAPMIDVIFILLAFFITTQIFSRWEMEIDVKLPTAETGKMPKRLPGEIIVNVLRDGTMTVNQRALSESDLRSLLNRIVAIFPGQPVLIRADRQTSYEHVVHVLDVCRKADVYNISFATATTEDS